MHVKLVFLSLAIWLLLAWSVQAQSTAPRFTLQVGSFPDVTLAKQFATKLALAGEQSGLCTVGLPGRGRWTRVLVGDFPSFEAARRYGDSLRHDGLIETYLIIVDRDQEPPILSKPKKGTQAAGATGTTPIIKRSARYAGGAEKAAPIATAPGRLILARKSETILAQRAMLISGLRPGISAPLPRASQIEPALAPAVNTDSIPHRDAVQTAFSLVTGVREGRGGLWITGDRGEGLARLRWIAGRDAELISLDQYGRVKLDTQRLAEAAAVNRVAPPAAPLAVVDYLIANEGLLILVQLSAGKYRYCLHIGRWAATAGGLIEVSGSINLDNNFDSRINPYRRHREKLDSERPPAEFDSMVAMNPQAQWFNLRTQSLVPVAHIAFHELAEAHAKLVFSLDYLMRGEQPGAHDIALEREAHLKAQRPLETVVITLGLNRVLKSIDELRQVSSQTAASQR